MTNSKKYMTSIIVIISIMFLGLIVYLYKNQNLTLKHLSTKSYLNPKTYTLNPEGTPIKKVMDHDSALAYILAWKKYDGVSDGDSSYKLINTPEYIRADVSSLEFEYNSTDHILIVRALLDKRLNESNPKFHTALLENLYNMEKKKEGFTASFDDAYIEDDMTSGELNSEYSERLNLRLDFNDASMSTKDTVNIFDNLSSLGYAFKTTDYQIVHTKTYKMLVSK